MKGLVLKDIYCIRFTLILGLLLALFPNIMLCFAGIGVFVGSSLEIIAYFIYGISNFITVACFSSIILNTLKDDVAAGWAKYQLTMPVKCGTIILSKQLSTLVLLGILTLCCYIPNIFAIISCGFSAEIMLMMPIVLAMLCVIPLMLAIPAALRFGSGAASWFYIGFLIIMMIGLTIMAFILGDNAISPNALRAALYIVLPIIDLAVVYISYLSGKKLLVVNLERE